MNHVNHYCRPFL